MFFIRKNWLGRWLFCLFNIILHFVHVIHFDNVLFERVCYWFMNVIVCEKIRIVICKTFSICMFLFVCLPWFGYRSEFLIIFLWIFCDNGYFYCWLNCCLWKSDVFYGVVSVGRIGETLCCVVGLYSTNSSIIKIKKFNYGVWILFCVRFLISLKVSGIFINIELKLFFLFYCWTLCYNLRVLHQ